MKYIDVCTNDEYDRVIKFLLDHHITIADRNKLKLTVAADMSDELMSTMVTKLDLGPEIVIGNTPFF